MLVLCVSRCHVGSQRDLLKVFLAWCFNGLILFYHGFLEPGDGCHGFGDLLFELLFGGWSVLNEREGVSMGGFDGVLGQSFLDLGGYLRYDW